ncbi:anti-anti-sigma factor [Saccharopolyspora lacisalsi]|uniref:Anti-sigma factor antagonist n=1 Tax=Halosaccharopolyspora lacisalsi TaxID=1000566 RepID=A0A839DZU5_9PSEU|nr:STAS domain-containing protein [Halosaccharopolyspora lacisalsi]MBA8824935.1 anti-anti-sigma factor [Halosaccharopolyspora lacisalsi]
MLTSTPFTDHPAIAPDAESVADGGPTPTPAAARSALLLRMNFSDPQLAVLTMAGDLDTATAPRLAELLWSRLSTKLPAIVLDLSGLTFLGVAGLELLASAHAYAGHRGIRLVVVNHTRTVDRALAAGGLDTTLSCFATAADARAATVSAPAEVATAGRSVPSPRPPSCR